MPIEDRPHYKLVNEYRIRNAEEKYIRVIEQQLRAGTGPQRQPVA